MDSGRKISILVRVWERSCSRNRGSESKTRVRKVIMIHDFLTYCYANYKMDQKLTHSWKELRKVNINSIRNIKRLPGIKMVTP